MAGLAVRNGEFEDIDMKKPVPSCAIGVDLGGTFIKAGVVDAEGQIIYQASRPTEVEKGREAIIDNIARAAENVLAGAGMNWDQMRGVGVGSPGIFDYNRGGYVYFAPNLKSLEGCVLPKLVQQRLRLNLPVILENDANAAAYGEKWVGMGRAVNTLVLFTLGTGIGGGIVLDGSVWHGSTGFGGELGHMTIIADGPLCGCGNRGCIEALASAPSLVRRLHEAVQAGRPTVLAKRVRGNEKVTAKDIYEAAAAGDATAADLMTETGQFLGVAAASMINVLNPHMIVFGGGMTAAGEMLLNPIREETKKRAIRAACEACEIVFSRLGNDAGLIGAAGCVLKTSEISAS
jgi:glucokinase